MMAGLKRSMCPTVSIRPASAATSIMVSASSRVAAIGFSTSTLAPARSAATVTGRCRLVGATMLTRSSSSSANMRSGSS